MILHQREEEAAPSLLLPYYRPRDDDDGQARLPLTAQKRQTGAARVLSSAALCPNSSRMLLMRYLIIVGRSRDRPHAITRTSGESKGRRKEVRGSRMVQVAQKQRSHHHHHLLVVPWAAASRAGTCPSCRSPSTCRGSSSVVRGVPHGTATTDPLAGLRLYYRATTTDYQPTTRGRLPSSDYTTTPPYFLRSGWYPKISMDGSV